LVLIGTLAASPGTAAELYDIAILNGRVIDPETMFDAVCNVGIKGGRIAAITTEKISGRETIEQMSQIMTRLDEELREVALFDPKTVTDNATCRDGENARPSTGIPFVIVDGTVVVKDS
jgi:N-acyl-D-aspartate/D-glutamate deacylase